MRQVATTAGCHVFSQIQSISSSAQLKNKQANKPNAWLSTGDVHSINTITEVVAWLFFFVGIETNHPYIYFLNFAIAGLIISDTVVKTG